ncbi:hypothetical protein Trydic_g17310 [Trypoxylus dichotomus]
MHTEAAVKEMLRFGTARGETGRPMRSSAAMCSNVEREKERGARTGPDPGRHYCAFPTRQGLPRRRSPRPYFSRHMHLGHNQRYHKLSMTEFEPSSHN